MIKRGVLYCVTDSLAYLESALISALALRSLNPRLPITIISNCSLLNSLGLERYEITPLLLPHQAKGEHLPFISRSLKTCLNDWSPYEETLFLDADILPCQPIDDVWQYIEQTSIAMVLDRLPFVEMCDHIGIIEKNYTLDQIPLFSYQFNSGVMLWRNNADTHQLFTQWNQEWNIFQKQDQLALVRALHQTQISVTQIPRSYNVSPIDSVALIEAGQKITFLHCWGGMVASGEFRKIAQLHYPHIVDQVDNLFLSQRTKIASVVC